MAGEAVLSAHNASVLRARGAVEPPDDVYPRCDGPIRSAFIAMALEGALRGPSPPRSLAAGLVVFGLAKALKAWAIASLGPRWTFRVLVPPGAPLVTRGPYRVLRHPNYLAVCGEIIGVGAHRLGAGRGRRRARRLRLAALRRIAVEDRALGPAVDCAGHAVARRRLCAAACPRGRDRRRRRRGARAARLSAVGHRRLPHRGAGPASRSPRGAAARCVALAGRPASACWRPRPPLDRDAAVAGSPRRGATTCARHLARLSSPRAYRRARRRADGGLRDRLPGRPRRRPRRRGKSAICRRASMPGGTHIATDGYDGPAEPARPAAEPRVLPGVPDPHALGLAAGGAPGAVERPLVSCWPSPGPRAISTGWRAS